MGWYDAASGGTEVSTANPYNFSLSTNTALYAKFLYDFSTISYRDVVSITGGTYTQTDGTNSFSHTISAFKMARYEVTYELWYEVHDWARSHEYFFANPGIEGNDGTLTDPAGAVPTAAKYEPVTTINWRDAVVLCNAYSEMSGYTPVYKKVSGDIIKDSRDGVEGGDICDAAVPGWNNNGYRLPTEGEWQYAASGTPYNHASGAYTFFDDTSDTNPNNGVVDGKDANDEVAVYGFYWDGSNWQTTGVNKTADVGTKTTNQLVIHDMSGNVWEWCWDWYGTYPGDKTDYTGLSSGSYRVLRGGSWNNNANNLQLGNRNNNNPNNENNNIGFRLASGQ